MSVGQTTLLACLLLTRRVIADNDGLQGLWSLRSILKPLSETLDNGMTSPLADGLEPADRPAVAHPVTHTPLTTIPASLEETAYLSNDPSALRGSEQISRDIEDGQRAVSELVQDFVQYYCTHSRGKVDIAVSADRPPAGDADGTVTHHQVKGGRSSSQLNFNIDVHNVRYSLGDVNLFIAPEVTPASSYECEGCSTCHRCKTAPAAVESSTLLAQQDNRERHSPPHRIILCAYDEPRQECKAKMNLLLKDPRLTANNRKKLLQRMRALRLARLRGGSTTPVPAPADTELTATLSRGGEQRVTSPTTV